jgi:hypothetical protein
MSASAPFHHISHRAMATMTSYAMLRRWQKRSHFVSRELIISRRFHIASRNGDSNNKVAAATTFVGSNLLVLILCRSKATTNGEEMSARHIPSRDGNNDLSCACTQRRPTATTNHIVSCGDTNWLRQYHLLSASPSCIHNVSRKSDDKEQDIALHNGRQRINCVVPWQRLITLRRPGGLAAHPFTGINARLLVLSLFGVFPVRSAPFRACAPSLSDSSESIFLTASASAPAQTAVWPAFATNSIRPLVSAFLADLWARLTRSGAGCASSSETLPALFFRRLSWIRAALFRFWGVTTPASLTPVPASACNTP